MIDRFQILLDGRSCNYKEYLTKPDSKRSNDEANAVDQQFARYILEWLGFSAADWSYNLPQSGQKANRPDYIVNGSIGTAFIWEDKNSTVDLDNEHLTQMRRYSIGTAGYAVWCNMRRILAVRFSPSDTLRYETLVDVSVEQLFGIQPPFEDVQQTQGTNLALFKLLFGKERFSQFSQLVSQICVDEQTFENQALPLDQLQTVGSFIGGSRQSLEHLRLAALSQIREALSLRNKLVKEEATLRKEWETARDEFIDKIRFNQTGFDATGSRVLEAIERLTPRLGEIEQREMRKVQEVLQQAIGVAKLSPAVHTRFEKWLERALRINSALLSLRFEATEPFKVAEAYRVWSERQSDQEDVKPEVFAEQVAYVFFVRLLLVRVLEDKRILHPRLASDGGFIDWSLYVRRHFRELDGIGILNENFCNILSRKASYYYLHFFQQAVFDWFNPDDFLLVETLEFLCRYNFQDVTSDIIGFTYEEYIDRNARNRKGHFLTRHEVVEYMLDLLDYTGPQIVGRRIFDPASGSGSFLVHAARRYRRALVSFFCNRNGLADSEEHLTTNPALRRELASRYLNDLTTLFFGMELNPFACYLAEMNLLIQALDDLFVLQQSGDVRPIERFHIYNTDSLDLPREVLDNPDVTGTTSGVTIPDRLSDRLTDEAYPIKAKLGDYAEGFFYIISNPPYVNRRQERFDVSRFRNAEFYRSVLSGDTNLYLLFLRLSLYYLAEYGRMIYIIPLTIFGDRSASAARKLLKTPPFSPDVAVRFYRGDILFPGVDQAVGIIRVNRSRPGPSILVSGGEDIPEVRATQFSTDLAKVVEAVPQNDVWQGSWLVANSQVSLDIWQHVRQVSNNFAVRLGALLDSTFDRKQGDVNATALNPLRLGEDRGSFSNGDVAIYKGEDVRPFTPLPPTPSDWASPLQAVSDRNPSREVIHVSQVLEQLKRINDRECGIVLREVARLNTRERLIATWFERRSSLPIAFTHELWRMILKNGAAEEYGKALLALINSKVTASLVNLFSTNNHVMREDLSRVPIPDPQTMPVAQLTSLAQELLNERSDLEKNFVMMYRARLPEFDDGEVYIPPSAVLAASKLPKLRLMDLVGRGEVRNNGVASGRIKALSARNLIVCTANPTDPNTATFAQVLDLFLQEPWRGDDTWSQAQNWQLPEMVAAADWLRTYNALCQQAQESWDRFVAMQQQLDDMVADWYGFDAAMRAAIAEGLPWARRRRNNQ